MWKDKLLGGLFRKDNIKHGLSYRTERCCVYRCHVIPQGMPCRREGPRDGVVALNYVNARNA